MKNIVLATNVVWGLNFIAAFGVFLFALVFVILPAARKAAPYAQWVSVTRPPKKDTGGGDTSKYSPIWTTPYGDVTVKAGPTLSGLETRIEIAGIMHSPNRKASMAFVNVGGDQKRIKEGDTLEGARVKEIRVNSVVFTQGTKDIEVFTKRAVLSSAGNKTPRGTDNPSKPDEFSGTKKTVDNADKVEWQLDPREMDYLTKNVDSLLSQVKLSPYAAQNGEMGGLILDEVTPGSFADARGFLKGDIVREVEGQKLTSVDDVKKLANAPEIQGKDSITITVERAGRPVSMVFHAK